MLRSYFLTRSVHDDLLKGPDGIRSVSELKAEKEKNIKKGSSDKTNIVNEFINP